MSEEAPESPQDAIENGFWVILHMFPLTSGQVLHVASGFLLLLGGFKEKLNGRIERRVRFASHDEGAGLGYEPAWQR